ncbi:MAG: S41 family peptidase [Flavobacteriaceae bacterium]|nr:S41 family peptidase [Flavobacteriaceae bacterium]MDG2314847.1 S41 family peptidase [Flavobacteriaceae bacterium]
MKYGIKILLVALLLSLSNCKDRDDDYKPIDESLEIKDFVWKGLNYYYYWQTDVNDLADNRFSTSEDYTSYLKKYTGPEELFDALLYPGDRFSWIVDDYEVLENALNGITQSNGMEFGLSYIDSSVSNKLIGFVRYVLPNSDAAANNIKRGDIFYAVNDIELTIDNYRELLFSDTSTYSIAFASVSNGTVSPNGISVSLTKEVGFQENPIHVHKVLNVGGKKVGYLMYNGFIEAYDSDLTGVIMDFKTQGIDELVLDFRYNPGGRVSSAIHLASLVTGQFSGSVFAKKKYNGKINDNNLNYYFKDVSVQLNMDKVYVITTSGTASASELVINGLKPYIEVIQVGDNTVGKNVASTTIKDWIDNDGTVNPDHKWAMQPIILKISNSEGFADYESGLNPDVKITETISEMGILGDIQEPLLSKALEHMGVVAGITEPKGNVIKTQEIANSKIIWETINGNVIDAPIGELNIEPQVLYLESYPD